MMREKFDSNLIPPAPDLRFEKDLWALGIERVAGVDEAGRGALAGPVAAAAVILPPDPDLEKLLGGVRDSKMMTPGQREFWMERIQEIALAWSVAFASSEEIDEIGIAPATHLAARRALEMLCTPPQHLLLDYLVLRAFPLPQTSLIKGDARSLSIAAASVLAKTTRDARLRELDAVFPGYGFSVHKGYGTAGHRQALARLGPSPVHRSSFAPVRDLNLS